MCLVPLLREFVDEDTRTTSEIQDVTLLWPLIQVGPEIVTNNRPPDHHEPVFFLYLEVIFIETPFHARSVKIPQIPVKSVDIFLEAYLPIPSQMRSNSLEFDINK